MATDPSNKYGQLSNSSNKTFKAGVSFNAGNEFSKSSSNAPAVDSSKLNINFIQDFQWATKYRYLLNISNFDGSMGTVIPATSITHKIESVRYENIRLPRVGTMKFPVGKEVASLQATVYDTVDCKTEWAFREWLNNVNGNTNNIKYVNEVTKTLLVARLDENKKMVMIDSYDVIIDGDISVNLASDSGLKELIVDFIVVGRGSTTLHNYVPKT